jgi:hypothetical protein
MLPLARHKTIKLQAYANEYTRFFISFTTEIDFASCRIFAITPQLQTKCGILLT